MTDRELLAQALKLTAELACRLAAEPEPVSTIKCPRAAGRSTDVFSGVVSASKPYGEPFAAAGRKPFARPAGPSGYRGVSVRASGRFEAKHGGKSLGVYDTALEAARVYDAAAQKHLGDRAILNGV